MQSMQLQLRKARAAMRDGGVTGSSVMTQYVIVFGHSRVMPAGCESLSLLVARRSSHG
jgi:hypothetical protein